MIPSLKGKAFVKYSDVHIQSLAGVLKQHGYKSIAFSAYGNPNFDNTSQFLLDHGYDAYETVDPYLLPEDHQFRLKWGVKDDVFFKAVLIILISNNWRIPCFFYTYDDCESFSI